MAFNILMDNIDNHEKNHAFLRALDGDHVLSPAYDVVPSIQGLGQGSPFYSNSAFPNVVAGQRISTFTEK